MKTWEDGTPRSTGNAFGVLYEQREKPVEKKPRKRTQARKNLVLSALETPQERALRRVLRVNKSNHNGPYTQAAKDRNAAIAGKSLFLGSNP